MTDSDSIQYSMQRKIHDLQAANTELLKEVNCLKGNCKSHQICDERARLQAEVDRLKRYECSWNDCGAQKKNRELQAEVERLRKIRCHCARKYLPTESNDATP